MMLDAKSWLAVITGTIAIIVWWLGREKKREDAAAQKNVDEYRKAVSDGDDSKIVIMLDDAIRRRLRDKGKSDT